MKNIIWKIILFLGFSILCQCTLLQTGIRAEEQNMEADADDMFLLGNYEEALSKYQTEEKSTHTLYGEFLCELKLGHYFRSIEMLAKMEELEKMDVESEQTISDNRISKLKTILQKKLCSPEEMPFIQNGRNLVRNERTLEAVMLILKNCPDYPDTVYYRGRFLDRLYQDSFLYETKDSVLEELTRYFQVLSEKYPGELRFRQKRALLLAVRADHVMEQGGAMYEILESERRELAAVADEYAGANGAPPAWVSFLNMKYQMGQAEMCYLNEEYDKTERICEALLLREPDSIFIRDCLMRCYAAEKKFEQSAEQAEAILEGIKRHQISSVETSENEKAYAYAFIALSAKKMKNKEKLTMVLQELENCNAGSYHKACAYGILGKRIEAFQYFKQAVSHVALNEREELLQQAEFDMDLSCLHIIPAFRKLVGNSYSEERKYILSAYMILAGLIVYFLLWYFDVKKQKKLLSYTACFLTVILIGICFPLNTYAYQRSLQETETEALYRKYMGNEFQMPGNDLNVPVESADAYIENIIEEFTSDIRHAKRTIKPQEISRTQSVATLLQPAIVNLQSYDGEAMHEQGSGIIVSYQDDEIIIVSCRHILYSDEVKVRFTDGSTYPAELIGKSEHYDVCFVKVKTELMTEETKNYIKRVHIDYFANASLQPGDVVVTSGYITTRGYIYYEGIVSNMRKSFSNFEPYYTNHVPYLLTVTGAEAGTSGGGTFDGYGNLIGMQAGIVIATGERYVVPLDILAEQYKRLTGGKLE